MLGCLWANLAETLVDGWGRSWLRCHVATRWCPDLPQGGAARVLIKRAKSAELASNASDGQMTPFCMYVYDSVRV